MQETSDYESLSDFDRNIDYRETPAQEEDQRGTELDEVKDEDYCKNRHLRGSVY